MRDLPNRFISLSAGPLSPADQLTAHVNHDAVLLSRADMAEAVCGPVLASSRFVLDEAAFMDALEPLPVFLSAPRVDLAPERDRMLRLDTGSSLSAVLRELSELVHPQDLGVQRP